MQTTEHGLRARGGGPVGAVRSAARRAETAVRRGPEPLWRGVFNLPAQVHFWRHRPELRGEAERVSASLHRDGVAVSSVAALTGDDALFDEIRAFALEAEARRLAAGEPAAGTRPFLTEMLDPHRPVIDPRGPVARFALAPGVKGVVDEYFGLTAKLSDANVWRNEPNPAAAGTATQLWHRDLAEDRCILKVFVHLEDVPEGGGPFIYARGTHLTADGKDRDGMVHDGTNYRVADEARSRQLERDAKVCTGPAGTVVVADVRGLHRGGLALTDSRFLLQMRFTSATALKQRMLAPPAGVDVRPFRRHLSYDLARATAVVDPGRAAVPSR